MIHTPQPTHKGNSIDAIWYLIVGLIGAAIVMTVLGLIDWTPPQANVPQTDDVFTQQEMREAVENGSLKLNDY